MESSVKKIDKNILRVIWGNEETYHPGDQFLPEVMERTANECQIQAEAAEDGTVSIFGKDGKLLTKETACTLTAKEVFRYTFTGSAPEIVTEKTIDGERSFVKNADTVKVADAFEGKISFTLEPDEAVYGLGQQEDGIFNYRNVKEYFYQNNMKIPMSVILSSKGYALVFDAACMFTYEEKDNVMTFDFDAVDQIVCYVIEGENFDELIAGIRSLTGKAVMLPKWAFGYVQSKERYKTQEEILNTAAEFEKRDIPLNCIVLDWLSWDNGKWGNKRFDKSRFPEARKMVDELHKKGVHFMISVWPNMNRGTDDNEEMAKAGKLLCNYSTYDAFDPEARDLYWKQAERELFAAGTDAWWCDSTEPFTPDWGGEKKRPNEERFQMAKESTNRYLDARYSNCFALEHAKGIYEHQRKADDTKRVVNLTRSGSLGSQRYGTILWSGDIAATWDVLKAQIAEGQSMAMSGIPYWTLDAGAFFTGTLECWRRFTGNLTAEGPQPWFWHGLFEKGVADLGYRELYTRWLQMAAYLPVMRSHGTDTPREPWNFGEPGDVWYDTIVKYIRKRCAMMPYAYSLAHKVYAEDYTFMRSLMFDFAADPKVKTMAEEYMYGPAYLVSPVTRPMEYGPESTPLHEEKTVSVYLPAGADWYGEDNEIFYEGGQDVTVEAGVDTMPVFVRAGSVIPKASEADAEGICDSIHVYTGADGTFTLYLDNEKDYAYENGVYSLIDLEWKDAEKTLVLTGRKTDCGYPEKLEVVLHTPEGTHTEHLVWDGTRTELVILK